MNEIQCRITIVPAPDIAPSAYRGHCEHCAKEFVAYFPRDFWLICPSCQKPGTPEKGNEWKEKK